MFDRARQALVKQVLEPEWEAQFEPNSFGFRPRCSAHDAIEAIFNFIRLKPKYTLDTDLEKCFDKIAHPPHTRQAQHPAKDSPVDPGLAESRNPG